MEEMDWGYSDTDFENMMNEFDENKFENFNENNSEITIENKNKIENKFEINDINVQNKLSQNKSIPTQINKHKNNSLISFIDQYPLKNDASVSNSIETEIELNTRPGLEPVRKYASNNTINFDLNFDDEFKYDDNESHSSSKISSRIEPIPLKRENSMPRPISRGLSSRQSRNFNSDQEDQGINEIVNKRNPSAKNYDELNRSKQDGKNIVDYVKGERPTTAPRLLTGSRIGTPSSGSRRALIRNIDQEQDTLPTSEDFSLESIGFSNSTVVINPKESISESEFLPVLDRILSGKKEKIAKKNSKKSNVSTVNFSNITTFDSHQGSNTVQKQKKDNLPQTKLSTKKRKISNRSNYKSSHITNTISNESNSNNFEDISEEDYFNNDDLFDNDSFNINFVLEKNDSEHDTNIIDFEVSSPNNFQYNGAQDKIINQNVSQNNQDSKISNHNSISPLKEKSFEDDSKNNIEKNNKSLHSSPNKLSPPRREITTSQISKRSTNLPTRDIQTAAGRVSSTRNQSPLTSSLKLTNNSKSPSKLNQSRDNSPTKHISKADDQKMNLHRQKTIQRIKKQREVDRIREDQEKTIEMERKNNYAQFILKLKENRKKFIKSPQKEHSDSQQIQNAQNGKILNMYWKKQLIYSSIPSFNISLINIQDLYLALFPADGIHGIYFLLNKSEWIPISNELIPLRGATIIYNERIQSLVIYGGMIEIKSPYQSQIIARKSRIDEEIQSLKMKKKSLEEWIQIEIAHIEEALNELASFQNSFDKKSLNYKNKVENLNSIKKNINQLQLDLEEYCKKIDKRIDEKFYSENDNIYQLEQQLNLINSNNKDKLNFLEELFQKLQFAINEYSIRNNQSNSLDLENPLHFVSKDPNIISLQNQIKEIKSSSTYINYEREVKEKEKRIAIIKNSLQSFTNIYESKKSEKELEIKKEIEALIEEEKITQQWIELNSNNEQMKDLDEKIIKLKNEIKERRNNVSEKKINLDEYEKLITSRLENVNEISIDEIDGNRIWFFNIENQEWKHLKCISNTPKPTIHYSNVYHSPTNCMIIFGGKGENGASNEIGIFSFQRNSWIPIPSSKHRENVPSPRYNHTSQPIKEGMLIYGGFDGEKAFNDLWVYYILEDKWISIKTYGTPPPLCENVSSTIIGNDLLIWCFKGLYILQLQTMKWYPPYIDVVSPRMGVGLCSFDSKIVLYGGKLFKSNSISRDYFELDYLTWKSKERVEENKKNFQAKTNSIHSKQIHQSSQNQSPTRSNKFSSSTDFKEKKGKNPYQIDQDSNRSKSELTSKFKNIQSIYKR